MTFATGWIPDYPDIRDYSDDSNEVKILTDNTDISAAFNAKTVGAKVDLRKWCSPIENQGQIGSCTAHSAVGLVEYFERRSFGKHIDGSRLFIYKVTRNLLKWTGDTGAFLRSAMGALVLFGVPPEEYWKYDEKKYEEEPTAFVYSLAQNYQALKYYRLDTPGTKKDQLLKKIKAHCNSGIPTMFGFTVYNSLYTPAARNSGLIPFPTRTDKQTGGHAVMCVGYDNSIQTPNSPTKGAIIIRNSWGKEWGDGGYGYLPYDYVLRGLAVDWWAMTKQEWVNTGAFKQ
jgi:C1A family cysteine protease